MFGGYSRLACLDMETLATPPPPHTLTHSPPPSHPHSFPSPLTPSLIPRFLQSLADHPFFSENHEVHMYLTREQLPSHDYIGNLSLWSSLTSAYSNYQLSSVQVQCVHALHYLRSVWRSVDWSTCTCTYAYTSGFRRRVCGVAKQPEREHTCSGNLLSRLLSACHVLAE